MGAFKKGWYLIYTGFKQEKNVSYQLNKLKIVHYYPKVKSIRKWSDRIKMIISPLFPSYIFVYLTNMKDYYSSLNAKGVLYYVRFGDRLEKVSDSIIEYLKIIVDSCEKVQVKYENFLPGQLVTISNGPLIGRKCEIINYKNKEFVIVRIAFLNRTVLAEIPSPNLSVL